MAAPVRPCGVIKISKAGESVKKLSLGPKHRLYRVPKYTWTLNFLKEKVEEIHFLLVNCLICFSRHLKPEFRCSFYGPHACTRFHTIGIRAFVFDNQFVYILEGNEAGHRRANILEEIFKRSRILDNRALYITKVARPE